jgi:ketosteroid isomerase-like protein
MKRIFGSILCLVALLLIRSGGQTIMPNKSAELSASELQVFQIIKDFNRAFKNNDPEKYFSYIDDQITVITPSNPYRVEGIKDDREEFEFGIRSGAARVGYFQEMQPVVQLYDDVAVVTYFSRGSYGPEGQAKTLYYKETDVLVRKSGTWKIVHIHVSATL